MSNGKSKCIFPTLTHEGLESTGHNTPVMVIMKKKIHKRPMCTAGAVVRHQSANRSQAG